ncbi:PREDICTED: uncharacterized protein LOC109215413 [Nicotiana attenuata]|uniref:uncharacterized protein LOC109215413 n=1 Tax=Nicotiana attenuata TaxID=49451 RepID=UPI0009057F39|nr:PREDICTED: uncharacterized protein LOC109215413 [Nicotiana attenuata]
MLKGLQTPVALGTSRVSVPVRESVGGVLNGEKKKGCSSPKVSLHLEVNRRSIRRASSESDVIWSAVEGHGIKGVTLTLKIGRRTVFLPMNSDFSAVEPAKTESSLAKAAVSPGDGEMLSMYGKLVWESEQNESRAKSYFDQAIQASPVDCTVLGSYAKFMWEAEEDDEEEEKMERKTVAVGAAMVTA